MGAVLRISFAYLLGALFLNGPAYGAELDRPITAWPFLYRNQTQDTAETDVLWPVYHHERNKAYEKYSVLYLLFSRETDTTRDFSKTSVLWPVSVYTHERTNNSYHLFPVYWYGSSPEHSHSVLFPFYWNGHTKDRSYFHIWPLFGVNRNGESAAEYSTLYPFFRYARNTASGDVEVNAPWPLVQYGRTGETTSSRALPLYWYSKSPYESTGFVFPYYWRHKADGEAHGIAPLWYSSRGPGAQTDIVVPLYFRRKTPDHEAAMVFPFYFHSDSAQEHYRYIFPTYYSSRTAEHSFRTFFPVYYELHDKDSSLHIGLPLYANYKTSSSDLSLLLPFYYNREDRAQDSSFTYYFPFYGIYRRGSSLSRHFVFFPLYSQYRDDASQTAGWDVLWPLFHHESSLAAGENRALPFYLDRRTPDGGYTIGFPLYWSFQSGDSNTRLFVPFYGEHTQGDWYRKQLILGPLYIDTRDDHNQISRQDAFFFLYSNLHQRDRERSWFFPFYYHAAQPGSRLTLGSLALLPPYYINKQNADRELFQIWPFYGMRRAGSFEEHSVFWPLFRVSEDPEKQEGMTHILLYYSARKGPDSFTLFAPLWAHHSTPQSTRDGSLFLHWYEYDAARERTSFSLLWLIPPDISLFKFEHEPEAVRHRIFPLYSYSRNVKTDALDWSVLWILFSYSSEGEFASQSGILWKFITYERKDPETYDFRVLWRFVRSSKTATSSVFEFNPFYYSERQEETGSYWAILGGLFGVETKGEEKKYRFFWFF